MSPSIEDRIEALDWPGLSGRLTERGFAVTPPLLEASECDELARLFDDGELVLLEQRGARGHHKVGMRHGVSTVTRGSRTALGVIFHDAR